MPHAVYVEQDRSALDQESQQCPKSGDTQEIIVE